MSRWTDEPISSKFDERNYARFLNQEREMYELWPLDRKLWYIYRMSDHSLTDDTQAKYLLDDLIIRPEVDFTGKVQDVIASLLLEGSPSQGKGSNRANQIVKYLLSRGQLDPNVYLHDIPLYAQALSYGNFDVAKVIVTNPSFVATQQLLDEVGQIVNPYKSALDDLLDVFLSQP